MKSIVTTINITGQGSITIPPKIVRDLGVDATGGKLGIHYDPGLKQITVFRALEFEELHNKLRKYTKRKHPLIQAREFPVRSKKPANTEE